MAAMAIESLGYEIDTVGTGNDAIAQFKKTHYDFIFMDLGLPDIDGYSVTETIRELEKESQTHTPIVALTAHAEDEFRQNALKSGMDDFLSKPLTIDKAKTMIDKYVHHQKSHIRRIK